MANKFDMNKTASAFTKRTILVVGSWAKAQITIENIKLSDRYKVCAYMSIDNPGISETADCFRVGALSDIGSMVSFASEIRADMVIITTALPLKLGLVDELVKKGIEAFGPTASAARLENDKAFTRDLMKEYGIHNIPAYKVCDDVQEAMAYARELDLRVAVKPLGLTDGLGVKVAGEQLNGARDIECYISRILSGKNANKILIEERIEGPEFALQSFVNGELLLPTPPVQDFKKLLEGDKGLNTASMGSCSYADHTLPFIGEKDLTEAADIMKRTIRAFYEKTGETCKGFLYGQFMKTGRKLMLTEYNFRPGDPEWINTVLILRNNLADVIERMNREEEVALSFEPKATVCKYLVHPGYPVMTHQKLDIDLDREMLSDKGISVYFSGCMDEAGRIETGMERGVAFAAKNAKLNEAAERINSAISTVKGDFYYRADIGSKERVKGVRW